MVYILIFISKILENMIATLRLIVVANGKKILGSILQGIVSLIWILVTGVVIIDINKDVYKIIVFCLGCMVGSFLGSLIEEKTNNEYLSVNCQVKTKYLNNIKNKISNKYKIDLEFNHSSLTTIFLVIRRKELSKFENIIKDYDNKAIITTSKIKMVDNGLIH